MKDTTIAPVIIFAYNRLTSLKKMIESLQKNSESKLTNIYVFVDGPKNESDILFVNNVCDYVKKINGFKKIKYFISKTNQGLSKSIISGVSLIFNNYDKAIILEDDLVLSSNFLSYMNNSLKYYQNFDNVISISGYSNKVKTYKGYGFDSYFITRNSSWGWATWKNQWTKVDWNLNDWDKVKLNRKSFNKYCGSDCYEMLEDWKRGLNSSWAIRFVYSQFVQRKLSLTPTLSKVINDGFSGDGTHCSGQSRFDSDFDYSDNKNFLFPQTIILDHQINRQAMKYHSLFHRIKMKLKNKYFE